PSKSILLGASEGVVPADQRLAVFRRRMAPEGGYLHDLLAEAHMAEPEAPADDEAVPKQALHLLGVGRCHDVEVLRLASEEEIPHPPAHQVGQEAMVLQAIEDLEGICVDILPGYGVLGSREDSGGHQAGQSSVPKGIIHV